MNTNIFYLKRQLIDKKLFYLYLEQTETVTEFSPVVMRTTRSGAERRCSYEKHAAKKDGSD